MITPAGTVKTTYALPHTLRQGALALAESTAPAWPSTTVFGPLTAGAGRFILTSSPPDPS
jgi:hypothetical protein